MVSNHMATKNVINVRFSSCICKVSWEGFFRKPLPSETMRNRGKDQPGTIIEHHGRGFFEALVVIRIDFLRCHQVPWYFAWRFYAPPMLLLTKLPSKLPMRTRHERHDKRPSPTSRMSPMKDNIAMSLQQYCAMRERIKVAGLTSNSFEKQSCSDAVYVIHHWIISSPLFLPFLLRLGSFCQIQRSNRHIFKHLEGHQPAPSWAVFNMETLPWIHGDLDIPKQNVDFNSSIIVCRTWTNLVKKGESLAWRRQHMNMMYVYRSLT